VEQSAAGNQDDITDTRTLFFGQLKTEIVTPTELFLLSYKGGSAAVIICVVKLRETKIILLLN